MKFMVIDGNSILNRSFYGVRPLSNHEGFPTNAIYGFLSTYFKLAEEEAPDYTVVCFDVRKPTFRHRKFESYKATRKQMPDDLAAQMPVMKEILQAMGLVVCELEGYEADDLIGTISRQVAEKRDDCVIVTGDRDSLQLLREGVMVRLITSRMGQTSTKTYDADDFQEEYGFPPQNLVDLKSLMGDSSDNISGVPGIGEKTALELMHSFGSLEAVYQNLQHESIKQSVRTKLQNGEQQARDSYWLASIDCEVPLPIDLYHLPEPFADEDTLYSIFTRLEFQTFINRMSLSRCQQFTEAVCDVQVLENLEQAEGVFAHAVTAQYGVVYLPASLAAVCLLVEKTAYILLEDDFSEDEWIRVLKLLFTSKVKLVMHDAREWIVRLLRKGIEPTNIWFDTCIGAYLLNPAENNYDLARVAMAYLNIEISEAPLLEENAFAALGARNDAIHLLARLGSMIDSLYAQIAPQLEENGQNKLFFEVEMPLVLVLAEMQHIGCKIDPKQLGAYGQMLDSRIEALAVKIFKEAGEEFNINSPKQLGELLFDRLGLPALKKTKSGYSTNAEVLEALAGYHPIIRDVLEYRQLTKLKSTYVDGLLKVVSPVDGRIHSHFQQTVTATGRLSSTEPNLQNIPVRTDLGRELRRMFVAENNEYALVDADYSQIELRVLAHIANDEAMLEAFRKGEDIHASTASKVYGVPLAEVTPQMRSSCKAVNFGIVYGISDFSLANDIGVSRKEAAEFIKSYLSTYPGVAAYMDSIKAFAKEKGYVETLCGRRRYLPELQSKNFNLRSFGERVAMNTPIQGTAADIIKIAMVNVWKRLRQEKRRSRLILQVHDELILEAPLDEVEQVTVLLREEMEQALALIVPLVAEAHSGYDWYTAKG